MKYYNSFIALILVLSACTKESETEVTKTNSIIATWELYQSASGMMPLTTFPQNNGNTITFDSSAYTWMVNGVQVQQGNYTLTTDSVVNQSTCELQPPPSASPNRIVFDNQTYRTSFELNGNTLKIFSGCFPLDGGWSLYKKKVSHY